VSTGPNGRTANDVQSDIEREREQLASALGDLRGELGRAADVGARIRAHLPLAIAGAFALGFLAAGGLGATVRYVVAKARRPEPPPAPRTWFVLPGRR
jgi:hypothetical protein